MGFNARVDASINYEVRHHHHDHDDAKVYAFESCLDIEGVCTYPDDRTGDKYCITVYGHEARKNQFQLTLADCHVRDEDGSRKYRKVRGREVPVYDVPKGIGHIEQQRGTKIWTGWTWVSPRSVADMLILLPHVKPLFIQIHELKIARLRWIISMSLQTSDPAEE